MLYLNCLFFIFFIINRSTSSEKVDQPSTPKEEGKSKSHQAPEPLPVKEYLEGAGKNTFIRPVGCVGDTIHLKT